MHKRRIEDFPYEIEELHPQKNEELCGTIRGYKEEFIRVGPKKYFIQKGYLSVAASIYNLPLRPDDCFVVTYPKSGTTLCQELVWLLNNELNYEEAASTILNERCPFLEVSACVPSYKFSFISNSQKNVLEERLLGSTVDSIRTCPPDSPRCIKTHLPLSLLPPTLLDSAKVIYMVRDPRDIAVSFFHHHKLMRMAKPDAEFKPFWNYFISDNMFYAPYFKHVLEAWEQRHHPHMLFLIYEETIKDLPATIRRAAKFFGKTLSDDQVNKLANHLSFDNFKKNKSVNMEHLQHSGVFRSEGAFIRTGKSGNWRECLDQEMITQADEWIQRNVQDTDFRLYC